MITGGLGLHSNVGLKYNPSRNPPLRGSCVEAWRVIGRPRAFVEACTEVVDRHWIGRPLWPNCQGFKGPSIFRTYQPYIRT